jgi:predicted house-cleaning NTP pyrophosphatase (Maf/HAM1 superfamily)
MLLSRMGVPFEVIEPRVEEISSGMPGEIVVENARRKARSVHLEDGEARECE